MAWTTPKTWSSEPLTSLDLNTYMRDNQNHLKDRLDNGAQNIVSGATVLTTNADVFVDVDADKLSLTLVTNGGDVLVGFTGTLQSSLSGRKTWLNVAVDGVDYIADDGIIGINARGENVHAPMSFVLLVTGLGAGNHTFKLRWKTEGNAIAKLDVVDLHPQFWAKEL